MDRREKIVSKTVIYLLYLTLLFSYDETVLYANAQTARSTELSSNPEELLNNAKRALQLGSYVNAIKYLGECIKIGEKINKRIPEAYLMMANIQRDQFKDYPEAIQFYEKYLILPNAEKTKGLKEIAKAYYDWGMLYDSFFDSSVNLHLNYYTFKLHKPNLINERESSAIRYYAGLENYLYGRIDDAINNFSKVTEKTHSYNILSEIKLAGCYYQKGQKGKANQIWSSIKKISNNDILIISELLVTQLESKVNNIEKEALKKCQEVSQLLDKQKNQTNYYNKIRLNLSMVYCMINDLDNAYSQIRYYDPKMPDTNLEIAKFYQSYIYKLLAQLCFKKASRYYEECAKFDPSKSDIYNYYKGICYLSIGEFDNGIKTFEKVSNKPLNLKAQIYLAICYYNKGQRQKAIEIFDRISRDKNKDVLNELGYVYAKLNINLGNAQKYIQKSEDIYKTAFVYFQLGIREKDEMKKNLVLVDAIRLVDQDRGEVDYSLEKNDPIKLILLANLYYQRRMFDESVRIWMNFTSKYPDVYGIINILQLTSETWQMNPKEKIDFNWINQYATK